MQIQVFTHIVDTYMLHHIHVYKHRLANRSPSPDSIS